MSTENEDFWFNNDAFRLKNDDLWLKNDDFFYQKWSILTNKWLFSKIERIPDIIDSEICHDFIFMFLCSCYCLIDKILHLEHDFLSKYPLSELKNSQNLHLR